jgi:hypothetical protein
MGSRTRWTDRLITALFDVVPPGEVKDLMLCWLHGRDHNSEDVEVDITSVEAGMVEAIEKKRNRIAGVPERVWKVVEAEVVAALASRQNVSAFLPVGPVAYSRPSFQQDVRRAAFLTLRQFFTSASIERKLSSRFFFGGMLPRAVVAELREVLLAGTWLRVSSRHLAGMKSTTYRLRDDLWPMLPLEPVRFTP